MTAVINIDERIGISILLNLRQASTTPRCDLTLEQHITHRSWLKLLKCGPMIRNDPNIFLETESPQHDENSRSLGAERVLNGYFHIIEGNIGCACRRRVTGLDRFGLDTFAPLDKYHCEAVLGEL